MVSPLSLKPRFSALADYCSPSSDHVSSTLPQNLYTTSSDYQNKVDVSTFLKGIESPVYVALTKSIQLLFRDPSLSIEDKLHQIRELVPQRTRRKLISMVVEGGFRMWREFFQDEHGTQRTAELLNQIITGIEGTGYMNDFKSLLINLVNLLDLVCDTRDVKSAVMVSLLNKMYLSTDTLQERNLFRQLVDVPYDIVRGYVMGDTGPFEVRIKHKIPKMKGDPSGVGLYSEYNIDEDGVNLGVGRQWHAQL